MKMKMIVTGSKGFIGEALCKRLSERGVEVIGIDRKDGKEARDIATYLRGGDIDCVFHLAAQTSVFNGNIEQIRKDNIDTFIDVAQACNSYGVKLVYASSSTADSANTTSMYGMSKRFDEQFAAVYCKKATGVRLHNVYGPYPRSGTLLWYLLNANRVELYDMGRIVRCFTYIDDAIDGLIYAMNSGLQLVNVANVQPVTIEYVGKLVNKYRSFEMVLKPQKREYDKSRQSVNESVYLVPLRYTTIEDGVRKVFNERKES